jgi:cobalamin biosynthesis Mg chelatase CobN
VKKEIAVSAVFALLIFLAVMNVRFIGKLTSEIKSMTEETMTLAQRGEWDRAEKLAREAAELWEKSDARTHLVLRHTAIENADIVLNAHIGFMSSRNQKEAQGSARSVRSVINGIRELECFRLGSIF